jgi:hypothetical protein
MAGVYSASLKLEVPLITAGFNCADKPGEHQTQP